ncbi:P-loop containing nucleoside triphosphate hydrolase protein, partial [Rhodotorula sp. JG-1b]
SLWTDRYRPKRFIDLLGDERVHRSALLWLKEWDMCVFRGTSKANAAAEMKRDRLAWQAPDPWGRPQEKVLLLSGPPGLGKTTLAHVVARQAGYQVLEINASDDRTGRVVEERIRNALDSQALTTGAASGRKGKAKSHEEGRNRPTCVIVDEIDGAAAGGESSFVKTLVKLITEGSTLRKPGSNQARPLLRPIICICNDLYAPVLRPLRPLAKIVRFTPPTSAMLVKRLRTICESEELTTENKHLSLLVEVAEGDLRSCLNTLQFIKRNGSTVDAEAIRSSALGQKDTGTSSSQVLNRIFKKPPRKRGAPGASGVGVDERYVARIVRDVQTSGEYEKISQGCFENYLTASGTNAEALPRIVDALDWIWLYDQLDHRLRSEREYELLAYVPFAFVAWYPLFSSQVPNPVELPKTDYEASHFARVMYLHRQAHQEVADAFAGSIPQNLKALFTGTNVVTELLPLLNRVVAPDLKPVNSQIVKTDEKARLTRLVNTMITTSLTFALDKSEDGQLSYKLDPPIDVFVHFDGKRASDIAPGRFAVRQMILREVRFPAFLLSFDARVLT